MTTTPNPEDRDELLTLWRLRTSPEIHIEDAPTHNGAVALCGFKIPASAKAMSSRQPVARVRSAFTVASMCLSCWDLLDHRCKANPKEGQ
jgi:hypothetical protein